MAKQRPSVLKRQREQAKRQREQRKAQKAAEKRERRLTRGPQDADTPEAEDDASAVDENEVTGPKD